MQTFSFYLLCYVVFGFFSLLFNFTINDVFFNISSAHIVGWWTEFETVEIRIELLCLFIHPIKREFGSRIFWQVGASQ